MGIKWARVKWEGLTGLFEFDDLERLEDDASSRSSKEGRGGVEARNCLGGSHFTEDSEGSVLFLCKDCTDVTDGGGVTYD